MGIKYIWYNNDHDNENKITKKRNTMNSYKGPLRSFTG